MLAPLNRFKPSSKIFYWPFQGGTSFVDLLCFCSVLCLLCFVRVCLYVLRGHLLGKGWPLGSRLWCLLWVCHFPIGILGQVWYLIVSIADLCNLSYFYFWYPLYRWTLSFYTIVQWDSRCTLPNFSQISWQSFWSNKMHVVILNVQKINHVQSALQVLFQMPFWFFNGLTGSINILLILIDISLTVNRGNNLRHSMGVVNT